VNPLLAITYALLAAFVLAVAGGLTALIVFARVRKARPSYIGRHS